MTNIRRIPAALAVAALAISTACDMDDPGPSPIAGLMTTITPGPLAVVEILAESDWAIAEGSQLYRGFGSGDVTSIRTCGRHRYDISASRRACLTVRTADRIHGSDCGQTFFVEVDIPC
ncbi:MAG: hypothetical protein ACE5HU_09215 [Acidobacteriota bacterium]